MVFAPREDFVLAIFTCRRKTNEAGDPRVASWSCCARAGLRMFGTGRIAGQGSDDGNCEKEKRSCQRSPFWTKSPEKSRFMWVEELSLVSQASSHGNLDRAQRLAFAYISGLPWWKNGDTWRQLSTLKGRNKSTILYTKKSVYVLCR